MIAEGGIADVHEVKIHQDGREVRERALKVPAANNIRKKGYLARVQAEVDAFRALAGLECPYLPGDREIVPVDLARFYGQRRKVWDQYAEMVAMEVLQGNNLLRDRPSILVEQLEVAIAVAKALEAIHSRGVVHRDLSPANVFRRTKGPAALIDYNASYTEGRSEPNERFENRGVATIIPPEVIFQQQIKPSLDTYQFGTLLYYLLSGELPIDLDDEKKGGYASNLAIELRWKEAFLVAKTHQLVEMVDRKLAHAFKRVLRYYGLEINFDLDLRLRDAKKTANPSHALWLSKNPDQAIKIIKEKMERTKASVGLIIKDDIWEMIMQTIFREIEIDAEIAKIVGGSRIFETEIQRALLRLQISDDLQEVLGRTLAADADERPEMGEVIEILKAQHRELPPAAQTTF